jgi:hypothetical protein
MSERITATQARIGGTWSLIGGRWVLAIPVRGPIDTRWLCEHEWTPHVFPDGHVSSIDYDCLHCGTAREFGAWPENGPDPIRRWVARKLRWPWVID